MVLVIVVVAVAAVILMVTILLMLVIVILLGVLVLVEWMGRSNGYLSNRDEYNQGGRNLNENTSGRLEILSQKKVEY